MRMVRRSLLSALVTTCVWTCVACGGSRSAPPAVAPSPTVLALVLEVSDKSVRLLSSKTVHGTVRTPAMASELASIQAGSSLWIEYVLHGGSPDRVLGTGGYDMSTDVVAETPASEDGPVIVQAGAQVIIVGVPDSPDLSTVAFTRVEPSALDPARMSRVPLGTISVPRGSR